MKLTRLLVITALLQLSACSTFGFFYDHLPFFATWRIDSMFDLNSEQEERVENSTEEIKAWLKEESFPVLIDQLKEAKQRWEDKQFKAAVTYFDEHTQTFISNFLSGISPHLIGLLLTLDEENTQEYIQYNQDKTEEWFEYAESNENKIATRIERLENWFGALTDEQISRTEKIVFLLPNERNIRIANNENWVKKVVQAALERDEAKLKSWLADTSTWWLPEYKQLRADNKQQTIALIDMMIETMTPEQETNVGEVVEEWIEQLEGLD